MRVVSITYIVLALLVLVGGAYGTVSRMMADSDAVARLSSVPR